MKGREEAISLSGRSPDSIAIVGVTAHFGRRLSRRETNGPKTATTTASIKDEKGREAARELR